MVINDELKIIIIFEAESLIGMGIDNGIYTVDIDGKLEIDGKKIKYNSNEW